MPLNPSLERKLLHGLELAAPARGAITPECLEDIVLAGLADGALDDRTRLRAIAHVADCGRCRQELSSLVALLSDPAVSAESQTIHPKPNRRPRTMWAGAGVFAAAAVVALVVLPHMVRDTAREHRGPTITASAAPTPLAPVGDVASATRLNWSAISGAEQYRVTLYDAGGRVVFESQLTDTSATIPDSVLIAAGASYLWKVEVRIGWERWAASDLMEFRVRPGTDTSTFATTADASAMQSSAPDSLRLRVTRLSDAELVAAIRERPQDARDALAGTFSLAAIGPVALRDAKLAVARRIAAAYEAAWRDPFFVREVARFTAWPQEQRAGKVWADSVRRAGIATYSREGSAPAIATWRRAVARANAVGDTAGMSASLGNIGAVLAEDGQLDSAEAYINRSRALAAAVGDLRVQANAISGLAAVREKRDDIAGARERYAEAIALHERIGDSRGLASDYNSLAGLARAAGDFAEARRQLESALAINRRNGQPEFAATNLVNLAALASLTGDFARAGAEYGEALVTWRARREWANVADALRGLGDLELRRGDYPAARADLTEAASLYEQTGSIGEALTTRQSLAGAHAAEGDLQGALDELRRVQQFADSVKSPPDVRGGIMLGRADLAARFNSWPEAERLYAGAEALYRAAGVRAGEANAQQGQGMMFLAQDNPTRAKELLSVARRAQLAIGDERAAAVTSVTLARALRSSGDTTGARQQLAAAAANLKRLGDPVAAGAALGERASLEAVARFPAAAESVYRAALLMVGDRVAPDVTWRLHEGLGSVRRDQGSADDAVREFRAAVADIERAGSSLTMAERRSGFLTDKWDVYVALASLERARGNVAAAFDVSERVRASEMLEQLANGRVAAPRDTAAQFVAREQDLRHRIDELTRGLEAADAGRAVVRGPDVARTGPVAREALVRAQSDYAELLLELRERAPQHAALITRATSVWRDVAQRLGPDEVLVEYLLSDTHSVAFVLTRDTLVQVVLGANRHELARLVDFVRGTLQPRGSPRLDSLWRAPLRQLHRDLIAPIEATHLLSGKARLIVVPHAELHYLPFAALLSGEGRGQYLVEQYQLTVTPSASIWMALGARAPSAPTSGFLAFAPRPDALPASRQEVATIARFGGKDARVLVGNTATEAAFRREAPGSRVIHLATYGVLNKQNPLFSFVEFAASSGDDGRLEAHEVFGLRLNAELVVLSACQTGLASGALTDVPAGDDWIGLARAFLSAGAARVMASLWPVQDRATAALMEQFYQSYHIGSDPAVALAHAQRVLIATPATASPYYWAGFEVVGGR